MFPIPFLLWLREEALKAAAGATARRASAYATGGRIALEVADVPEILNGFNLVRNIQFPLASLFPAATDQ